MLPFNAPPGEVLGASAEQSPKWGAAPSHSLGLVFLLPTSLSRDPRDHPLPTSPHVGSAPWGSRSPCSPQKYVQDILQEKLAEPVYQALKEQGGHIYVCGDVTMAADVLKAIQRIVAQQGKLSVEDAGVFISRLRVSGAGLSLPFPGIRGLVSSSSPHLSRCLGSHNDILLPLGHLWLR